MRKIVLSLVMFFSFLQLFSQGEKYVSFAGLVKDSISQEPLQYATIVLLDAKGVLCAGAITDDKGSFNIKQIACKSYMFISSFVGYKSDTIYIDSSCNKKNVRFSINLSPQMSQLAGFEITAQKTGTVMAVDRDIFVPDSIQLKSSQTGLDILDKVPGVFVSQSDQSISYLGDDNVLILVNGVSSGRNINTINPKDIKQIETLNAPTSEYSSEVNTVINIILKDEQTQGFYTIMQLDGYLPSRYNNSNIQLDYNFKKIRIFGLYKLYLNNSESTSRDTYRWNRNGDSEYERYSKFIDSHKSRSLNHTFQYGLDYRIDKNNILNFTGQVQIQNSLWFPSSTETDYYKDGIQTNWYTVSTGRQSKNILQNYNLYYRHSFKNPKQHLSISTNFYKMLGTPSSWSNTFGYFAADSSSRQIEQTRGETNHYYSTDTKVDYSHPFSKNFDSQWGIQFFTRNINEEQYLNNETIDNFLFNEYRIMPYFNLTYSLKSFTFMAGLRAEMQNFNFHDTVQVNKWNFVPSFSALYNTENAGSFKLTYRTSLNYPQYYSLSPFVTYATDSLYIYVGNPYLKPSKTNTLNFTYSYQISQWHLSFSTFWRHIYDRSKMTKTFLDNNVLFYKNENIDTSNEYCVNFYGKNKFFKILTISVSASLSYISYPEPDYGGFQYSVYPGIEIELPANIFISAQIPVAGKYYVYDGYLTFNRSNHISVRKNLFKNKGSVTLSVLDLINLPMKFVYWDVDFYESGIETRKKFCVMLRFNYSFSYGKNYEVIRRELNMNEETK